MSEKTSTRILHADELFRIIREFERVWFCFISFEPRIEYEYPICSEKIHLDYKGGSHLLCAGFPEEPFASISCDEYQCKITVEDGAISALIATPIVNGSAHPYISLSVSQFF